MIGWEWIAGFFEGEGHIYWQEGTPGTKRGTGGRLIIGQKDKRPMQAIYDFLMAHGFAEPRFYLRPRAKSERGTAIWIISVQIRPDVIAMLEAVRPWLFQKAAKADYVITRLKRLTAERDAVLTAAFKLRVEGHTWLEIGRRLGIGRTALTNYARTKGIVLSRQPGFANEVEWRKDRIARGLCSTCGEPRGERGTTWKCRRCADKFNHWHANHRRIYGRKDQKRAA